MKDLTLSDLARQKEQLREVLAIKQFQAGRQSAIRVLVPSSDAEALNGHNSVGRVLGQPWGLRKHWGLTQHSGCRTRLEFFLSVIHVRVFLLPAASRQIYSGSSLRVRARSDVDAPAAVVIIYKEDLVSGEAVRRRRR